MQEGGNVHDVRDRRDRIGSVPINQISFIFHINEVTFL